MITLTLKLLGALSREKLASPTTLNLPDGASVGDLEALLKELGINTDSPDVIVSLSGKGLRQYPADHQVQSGEEVIAFPNISGGS